MKFTRNRGLLLVALVTIAWGGIWVSENFEMQEIRYPSSLRGEAVRNNLLAAERFAAALGAQATSGFGYRRLPDGPADRAVLVMPTQRRTLTSRQRDELLQWIEAGGHLVAVTYTIEGQGGKPDPLLALLGVRQYFSEEGKKVAPVRPDQVDDDLDDDAQAEREKNARRQRERRALERNPITRNLMPRDGACPPVNESGSSAPLFPVPGQPLGVCFDPWYRLESRDPPLWAVASRHGVHALSVARGRGRVTVLTDYDFMMNDRIARGDHPVFLAALLGFTGDGPRPQRIMFVPREDVPGILALTWQYAWPVVLALAAWLALGLWAAGARFGPLLPSRVMSRRSLAEHVRASGEFLWRHGERMHLWRATLAHTRRHIERVLPAAAYADPRQHLDALARRTGVDVAHVERALDSRYAPTAEQFPTIIATLELLRKKL